MADWDPKKKASKVWILLGAIGIGQLVALIYVLVKKNDKDRVLALLLLLGWLGNIILYFIQKDKDNNLSSLALYLLIGEIILTVAVAILYISLIFTLFSIGHVSVAPNSTSPVVAPNSTGQSASGFNPSSTSRNMSSCNGFTLASSSYRSSAVGECDWNGGTLSLYYGAGNSGYISFSLLYGNGTKIASNTSTFWGSTYFSSFNLPADTYILKLHTGGGGGYFGDAFLELDATHP